MIFDKFIDNFTCGIVREGVSDDDFVLLILLIEDRI